VKWGTTGARGSKLVGGRRRGGWGMGRRPNKGGGPGGSGGIPSFLGVFWLFCWWWIVGIRNPFGGGLLACPPMTVWLLVCVVVFPGFVAWFVALLGVWNGMCCCSCWDAISCD